MSRLLVADHQRQLRLAVPRRRLLGPAVDLVEAGLLVAVLAARDEPRAHDRARPRRSAHTRWPLRS